MKFVVFILLTVGNLFGQNYYQLTNIKEYDLMTINHAKRLDSSMENYSLEALKEMTYGLGIGVAKHSSRILAFVFSDVTVGKSSGLKIDLQLREQVQRKEGVNEVFALTYMESSIVELHTQNEDEIEDAIDDLIIKFESQYAEDNENTSKENKKVSYDNFASTMGYETDFSVAKQKAKMQHKRLMVFVTKAFCPWCRKFESIVLSNNKTNSRIQTHFVPVMLDYEDKQLPKIFKEISLSPVMYVVDEKKEKIIETFVGYGSKEAFLDYIDSLESNKSIK